MKKGNLSTHLEFLKGKARICMKELMRIGYDANLDKEALRVKLKLLVSTINVAPVNDLEVWEGTTPREYEQLQNIIIFTLFLGGGLYSGGRGSYSKGNLC